MPPPTEIYTLSLHDALPISVAGATLRVLQVSAAPGEDLGPWLEAVRGKKELSGELERQYLPRYTLAPSPAATTDAEDRKSTRLNSSHANISYAVFCLKKKTQ